MDIISIDTARYTTGPSGENSIRVTLTGEPSIVLSVPMDSANRHYQAILEWVAENNTIGVAYE
tara:strand:+ start:295 stop:483 length:189 start_codon:yes stop_codon:yes gene_type:complete